MIETEQTVLIAAPIGAVWEHVHDISRWAENMPGYRECDLISDDQSRWLLKVGVGGLVRTVTVLVTVERWDGPGRVDFTFALERDPVEGRGTYTARPTDGGTSMTLSVQVEGRGPMAPMWEAMGGPLLPRFAKSFAEQLKTAIEGNSVIAEGMMEEHTPARGWIGAVKDRLFGSQEERR